MPLQAETSPTAPVDTDQIRDIGGPREKWVYSRRKPKIKSWHQSPVLPHSNVPFSYPGGYPRHVRVVEMGV